MSKTTFGLLLIICVAALHADASQEAQLREFIRSRRRSSDAYIVDETRLRVIGTARSLGAEYSVSDQARLKAGDEIPALPGQPVVGFRQYGGYVTVDEKNGRALFYYFVEAASDPAAKPLLLWLNGGPGCSSIGYGAMMELGPFRVNSDNKTLSTNKHAWNNVANVIFLESPAGVGFSYSNTTSDYDDSGDQRTADDAFLFLVNWLERFPEYKGRAFYISGESYGGHYVPQLAATILTHNMNNPTRTSLNLQGILVGNPLLDNNMRAKGAAVYMWSHGVISDEVWANITKNCKFDGSDGDACYYADVHDSGNIDQYDIYGPVCILASDGTFYPSRNIAGYDPCSIHHVDAYLNDPEVQKALHARSTKWSHLVLLGWKDSPVSMVPTLKWLLEHQLPVWLFSGDFDSMCPLIATRYTINDLGVAVTEPLRPWSEGKEVGGYVQGYTRGLVFAIVRGAGHMVPSFQPERALILVSSFLKGMLPPKMAQ
ncbi:serine carboxypeptidase 1 [Lolium perenne]|uniref:serine carboxypeptidase 1 n=1 Tax=Lolium perenne TaxID=4522 RepID=UPI0021F68557|nr:serine carboxypeptidase 1-like [Lolium perenne]